MRAVILSILVLVALVAYMDMRQSWRQPAPITVQANPTIVLNPTIVVPSPAPVAVAPPRPVMAQQEAAPRPVIVQATLNVPFPTARPRRIDKPETDSPWSRVDYSKYIVTVEGDDGIGTGFLVKFGNWNAVATNAHVLSGDHWIKIHSMDGSELRTGRIAVAKNIDLAIVEVGYAGPFLPLTTSFAQDVQLNDDVIVLGNSQGEMVITRLDGRIKGIGPDRIEISNQFVKGNSGSPVIHIKSGKAIGIVTYTMMPGADSRAAYQELKDSPFNKIRRFAYRLDVANGWDLVTLANFAAEAKLVDQAGDTTQVLATLARQLGMGDAIHIDTQNSRMDRLAVPIQDYIQKTHNQRTKDHDSMDAKQELLRRLDFECTADIDLYRKSIVSSYHLNELEDARVDRLQIKQQIDSLLTR